MCYIISYNAVETAHNIFSIRFFNSELYLKNIQKTAYYENEIVK